MPVGWKGNTWSRKRRSAKRNTLRVRFAEPKEKIPVESIQQSWPEVDPLYKLLDAARMQDELEAMQCEQFAIAAFKRKLNYFLVHAVRHNFALIECNAVEMAKRSEAQALDYIDRASFNLRNFCSTIKGLMMLHREQLLHLPAQAIRQSMDVEWMQLNEYLSHEQDFIPNFFNLLPPLTVPVPVGSVVRALQF